MKTAIRDCVHVDPRILWVLLYSKGIAGMKSGQLCLTFTLPGIMVLYALMPPLLLWLPE